MARRRGDNIPSISDYAHYNEEAYAMWYAENRYDMERADEIIEDDDFEYNMGHDEDDDEEEGDGYYWNENNERNIYEVLGDKILVHIVVKFSAETICGRIIYGLIDTHDRSLPQDTCSKCWA
jgi:hypothetical protein